MQFNMTPILAAFALLSFAMAAPAAEAEAKPAPAQLEKRLNVGAQIYSSGACDSNPVFNGAYSSGSCHNFPNGGGDYGAKFQDSSFCKYKVWEGQNCQGHATVHGQAGGNCIPIANDGTTNAFYLTQGGASISIVC